jgi:hypothetical protein
MIMHQAAPPPDAPKTKPVCMPQESRTDVWCSWDIPHSDYFVTVQDPGDQLSAEQLTNIGQGLQFDDLDKPDTWHSVS